MLPNAAEKIGGTRYRPERRFVMSGRDLRTPFKTSEPEGFENGRSQLRTGAGEIGRAKITPTGLTVKRCR